MNNLEIFIRTILTLAFVALLFSSIFWLSGCAKQPANADNLSADCSSSISANGTWFRECKLFGKTCIVGEKRGYDASTIWCQP